MMQADFSSILPFTLSGVQWDNMEIIAANLKRLRERKRWSLEELADRCGIRKQELWRYENRQRLPKLTAIISLAKAFRVSLDSLVRDNSRKVAKR